MTSVLVGVDCAAVDSKIGLALAHYNKGRAVLKDVTLCARERSAADTLAAWLRKSDAPALLAIDAPLGRPAEMEARWRRIGLVNW